MPNIFNAAEVIDMGIEKEKKRRDFYGFAASAFKDKELKDLFAKLRDWEETHIKKFTEIRNSIEEDEASESFPGELASYIRYAVDDILYKQVTAQWFADNIKSELAAIQYGIGFEKDAILFFDELLRYMNPYHKEKIQALINEEKKHLVYLSELKEKYK